MHPSRFGGGFLKTNKQQSPGKYREVQHHGRQKPPGISANCAKYNRHYNMCYKHNCTCPCHQMQIIKDR